VVHVAPQVGQCRRNVKIHKVFAFKEKHRSLFTRSGERETKSNTCHSNVLKSGHELAIKAAERVTRKETIPSLSEVLINLLELRKQSVLGRLLFLQQHQLEFL